jgi:hypothetical protein
MYTPWLCSTDKIYVPRIESRVPMHQCESVSHGLGERCGLYADIYQTLEIRLMFRNTKHNCRGAEEA